MEKEGGGVISGGFGNIEDSIINWVKAIVFKQNPYKVIFHAY